jgi:hypothetical protein
MTRRHGRAARGLRLLAPVPHGHWKVATQVAGLRPAQRHIHSHLSECAVTPLRQTAIGDRFTSA